MPTRYRRTVRAVRPVSRVRLRRPRPQRVDRGSVTAETALALPVLVVVLLMAVWVLACVSAQLRCVDAARAAARAAARGDAPPAVAAAAAPVAPRGASVHIRRSGDRVEVMVRAEVRPFGAVLRALPATAVTGRAVADVEGLDPVEKRDP